MEAAATQLIAENLPKNFVDPRAYPATRKLEQRCLRILANLYHRPETDSGDVSGVSTIGSSEAIMLAVLAMKTKWLERQGVEACAEQAKPNLIVSSANQVCWPKAARYFGVQLRCVPCSDERFVLDPVRAVDMVDDQTIGICCIL